MEIFAAQNRKGIRNKTALLVLLANVLLAPAALARDRQPLEEIVVSFEIPDLIQKDIFVQYDGLTIYLPLMDIFQTLEMNVTRDLSGRVFSGYMWSRDDKFEVNLEKGYVKSPSGKFDITESDYYYSDLGLYLRIDHFGKYFNLEMQFEFSRLRVVLPLDKEFPVYKKLERKKKHEKLEAEEVALRDIQALPFKREYLKGGVADWMITATPLGSRRTQYFDLATGAMLLGGDLTLSGSGDTRRGVDWRRARYHWHYFFKNSKYLTQTELGNIFPGGPYARAMTGVLLTNKPQVRRKYFQTIDVSGNLGEGWEVELYVDGRLTDFMHTDENGKYDFNVDIYYGASTITLKMYGPNGEYTTEEMNVRVPHSLIPKGEFEYTVAGGEGNSRYGKNIYSHAGIYYGISHRLTLGAGGELPINSDSDEKPIYGGEIIFQPLPNMTVNTYYIGGHSAHAGMNYSQPSVANINAGYTHYFEDTPRNLLGQIDNLSLSISSPLHFLGRRVGTRLHLSMDRFPERTFTNATYGLNASFSRVHINYAGKYKLSTFHTSDRADKNLSSELYLTAKIFRWFQPQLRVDYDHSQGEPTRYGIHLAKRVFKTGQLSLSFERNELSQTNLFMVTLNLFTGFAHFTSRLVAAPQQVALSQIQRGSVRYDHETAALHFDRLGGVGYGSAVLRPFLDNNFNGVYDEEDELVSGLRARVRGSSGKPIGENRIFFYDRLHPYDEYLVQIDKFSLDNPMLKPTSENYQVYFNPNVVTAIEVPIVMAGEISGLVRRQLPHGRTGVGGIRLIVIDIIKGTQTDITTFNDGDFYHLGLIPGKYRIVIDRQQLESYGYVAQPEAIDFTIEPSPDGDIVSNLDFLLLPE